jgi:hypothetical protein
MGSIMKEIEYKKTKKWKGGLVSIFTVSYMNLGYSHPLNSG